MTDTYSPEKPPFDPAQPFESVAQTKPPFDPSKPYEAVDKGKGIFGHIDDAVRSLASGATFGYADEIAAKANELFGKGDYASNLASEKARDEQISPWMKIPGEIAGGVGSALATAPVTGPLAAITGASRLPGIVRAMGSGAGAGALYGSGAAEPDERLEGAAKGGLLGAAIGPVVQGGMAVGRGIRNAFNPQANVAADLGRALTRDQMTPAQLEAAANEAAATRPGVATLADAGGENVRGLVERIAQTPGAGRTTIVPALTERQHGQMARVATDLRQLTGTHQSAFRAVNETMEERAAAATPLYQRAYQEGDRAIWSPELERLSSSPTVRAAMQGAVRVWRDNAIADGFGAMNPGAMVDRGGILSFPGGNLPAFPNIQFWDYTKRMIDDRISQAVRAGQGQKARTLTILNQNLRRELDTHVPTYAEARASWEGPSRYLDAIEEGRGIFGTNVGSEELAANIANMGDAQREGYRIGAISSILGKMGNDPAKLGDMTKYLRSPEMRAKIAALMPTQEARDAWNQRLNFEVRSSEMTGRGLGGPATARRLAERQDAENIVGDLVMETFAGAPPVSLLRRAVMAVPQRVRDTLRSRSDDILAHLLTDPQSMAGLRQAIERIQAQGATPPSSVLRGAGIRGASSAVPELPNMRP